MLRIVAYPRWLLSLPDFISLFIGYCYLLISLFIFEESFRVWVSTTVAPGPNIESVASESSVLNLANGREKHLEKSLFLIKLAVNRTCRSHDDCDRTQTLDNPQLGQDHRVQRRSGAGTGQPRRVAQSRKRNLPKPCAHAKLPPG